MLASPSRDKPVVLTEVERRNLLRTSHAVFRTQLGLGSIDLTQGTLGSDGLNINSARLPMPFNNSTT